MSKTLKRTATTVALAILALSAALGSAPVAAMSFTVIEKSSVYSMDIISRHDIPELLRRDAQGMPDLNINPQAEPAHQRLVDLLAPAIPFDQPEIRKQIAGLLDKFPEHCKADGDLLLGVNPVDDIDRWVEGVTDKRRINIVYFKQCVKETPKACKYCLCEEGGFDFNIGSLKRVLGECSDALHEAISSGAELVTPPGVGAAAAAGRSSD